MYVRVCMGYKSDKNEAALTNIEIAIPSSSHTHHIGQEEDQLKILAYWFSISNSAWIDNR